MTSPYTNDLGVSPVGNLVAGADLSSHQNKLVQLDASGDVVAPTGQGVRTIGVLLNAPKSGEAATVQTEGVARVIAGAAITQIATGRNLTAAGTSGKVGTAASGDFVAGVMLQAAGGDGEEISMLLTGVPTVPLA